MRFQSYYRNNNFKLKYKISSTPLLLLFMLFANLSFGQGDKDGKLKKAWHNMVAHFNTYYHAQMILDEAVLKLENAHKDDFTKIVPVFPDGGEAAAKSITSNMEEVMMKTSKLIQAHPTSKWVDDAYLLLYQSYFYKYDLFAALEGFQYIYSQFNDREIKYDAQLWIMRTLIRQKKYYDAESIYGLILQEKNFPKRLNKLLYQSAADLYISEGKNKQALEMMVKVLPLARTRTEKYRTNFILGQLYYALGKYQLSYNHFERTIKLYPPYEYAFQANLGLSRMQSKLPGKTAKNTRKYLKRMLKDDKNIEYFDEIYYELANLELKEKKTDLAIQYYQQSAWASQKNRIQKANSYLALANLFFSAKNYTKAQLYFDSTVAFITKEHPQYEQITARQVVLSDLINSLVTIEMQDSLLRLSGFEKADLDRYIDRLIQKEKEQAELKKQQQEQNPQNQGNNFNGINPLPGGNQPVTPQGSGTDWYFYNQSALARGYTEFSRRWGTRKLTDYWRVASKAKEYEAEKSFEKQETKAEKVDEVSYNAQQDKKQQEAIKDVAQDKQKYYVNIPFSEQAKIVANIKIEKALFKAGKIYQENLKEYQIAIGYYQKLLNRYPETNLGAETVFNLIKCFEALGNKEEAARYATLLNDKYPRSSFNMVVNNKDVTESEGENKQIVTAYNSMYSLYQQGAFLQAMKLKTETDKQFAGNSLQAKFDLLFAMCVAKTDSLGRYLDLLRIIKENYPGTAVANTAVEYLDYFENRDKKIPEKTEATGSFTFSPNSEHFYILTYQGGNSESIKRAFSDYNTQYHRTGNLQIIPSVLGDLQMLVVKSFPNKKEAEKYYIEFIKNGAFFDNLGIKKYDNLYISDTNFKILLNEKKQSSYFEFFTKFYIE